LLLACFVKKVDGIKYFKVNKEDLTFNSITLMQRNTVSSNEEEQNIILEELQIIKDRYSLVMEVKDNIIELYEEECKKINSNVANEIKNITFKTKKGNFPITEFSMIRFSKELKNNFPCKFEKENPEKNCYKIYYEEIRI